MKNVFLIGACGLFMMVNCNSTNSKKDVGTEPVTVNEKSILENQNTILFTVKGKKVISKGWNINRFSMKDKIWINITSDMHTESNTININIAGSTTGKYIFGNGIKSSHGSYYPDYLKEKANIYQFVSGEMNITKIDTLNNTLNATFFGTVRNDKKEELEITEGEIINGNLKKGVTKIY